MLIKFRTIIILLVGAIFVVLGIVRSYPSHYVSAAFCFISSILSFLYLTNVVKEKKVMTMSFYMLGYVMLFDLLFIYRASGFAQINFYALICLVLVLGIMFRSISVLLIYFSVATVSLISLFVIFQGQALSRIDLIENSILFTLLLAVYTPLLVFRIHGQRRMEETIREKTKALEDFNRFLEEKVREGIRELRNKDALLIQQGKLSSMGEMVANIAHQWKQPLNALGITIQNLKDYHDQGVLDGDFLNKNVAKSLLLIQHMAHTIDDFRNFFKPDREKKTFELRDAVDRTLSLIDDSFRNNFIAISVDVPFGLKLEGYPGEFCQALLNILSNAKDEFVKRKNGEASVRVRGGMEKDHVVLVISNNAGNIDEKILPRIFEPYFTTKENGSGIGLYMTRMIIEKFPGGMISAKNVPHGAEFRISIPSPVVVINS